MNHIELNLLIVKETPSTALKLEKQIKKIGYNSIKTANNLIDVLQAIALFSIDLIILNIELKEKLDGIQLAKLLKKKNIPFLFITNIEDIVFYQNAKATKPIAYLLEPVKNYTLESILFNVSVTLRKEKKRHQDAILKSAMENTFFIKQNNLLRKITYDAVLWIKTEGNYSIIYTAVSYTHLTLPTTPYV